MDKLFYTQHQLKVFAEDLPRVFLDAGFEIIEEPYIDFGLCGFRATYLRRYLLKQPMAFSEVILTTIIHIAGLPFGHHGQKMVILTAPRNLKNETVSETIKLRIHFEEDGSPHVILNDQQQQQHQKMEQPGTSSAMSNLSDNGKHIQNDIDKHQQFFGLSEWGQYPKQQFYQDLAKYVSHVIEAISPGLIQLPIEMKLEILKKLSIESILKVSQVNSEFRRLIFKQGESLWRYLCYRDFKIKLINRLVHKSWMELYRDTYLIHQVEICRKERALPGVPVRLALPPAPYRQPIEWLPEVLELPFYPMNDEVLALPGNPILALEFHPLRRADSLDSLR